MYPEIDPFRNGRLQVSPIHDIYFEEIGNPNGLPVLFLHGGPGGGIYANCRKLFDPNVFHTILFDQRGAGKSTPYASIEENTTPLLIEDIEKLRHHLQISQWIVFGGSWGATLALAYAISHPDAVLGLILRGVFLGRRKELQWLYGTDGAARIFPKSYAQFSSILKPRERKKPIQAYYKRLISEDIEEQKLAVAHWNRWESSISQLIPDEESAESFTDHPIGLAIARIESHYFVNQIFLPDEQYLLRGAKTLAHIPTEIVNGRYDIVCPVATAYELHQHMPHSRLNIISDAGHSTTEYGISRALIQALRRMKQIFV